MGSLSTHLYEVRRLIGDRRPGDPVCVDPFLEELTDIAVDELHDEIGMGLVKTTSFATLTAGSSTYTVTLPSSAVTINHIKDLVLASTGRPLDKKDMAFILAMRANSNEAGGEPWCYALLEGPVAANDATRKVTLEIHPSPVTGDTITAYWEPGLARIQSGGNSDTQETLHFSKVGLTALRMRVAGKAILALPPEALARLNPPKTPSFGTDLLNQSAALAVAEFARLHEGVTPDVIQRTR